MSAKGSSVGDGGLWAVIPVKPLDRAKSRLSPALSASERAALAEAMFRDVLAAARRSRLFDQIIVATSCQRAAAIAWESGALVMRDLGSDRGTNGAVEDALAAVPDGSAAMVIQADLPLLEAADLIAVAMALRAGPRGVVLVPALDGGTTILGVSPARAIRPAFGADSFARHLASTLLAGLRPEILRPARAVCDLDRPDDIALLSSCRPDSHSARLARPGQTSRQPIQKPKQESLSHDEGDLGRYLSLR